MKTRFLLTAFVAMISFLISTIASAQVIPTAEVNIDWEKYATTVEAAAASGESVYLYAPAQSATGNNEGFLAMQGTYGVHGVLRSTGQRLKLEPISDSDGVYAIQTSVNYTLSGGSITNGYLGRVDQDNSKLYLDRHTSESNVETNWHFVPVTDSDGNTGYGICFGDYTYDVVFDYRYDVRVRYYPTITVRARPKASRQGLVFDSYNLVSISYSYSGADKRIQCANGSTLNTVTKTYELNKYYGAFGGNDAKAEAQRAFNEDQAVKDWYNATLAELKATCENNIQSARTASSAVTWYIITESAFRNLILSQEGQSYLNVSGLLYDQRFERNSTLENKWKWDGAAGGYFIGLNSYVGSNGGSDVLMNIASDYGAYYAAEVSGTGKFTQTIEVPRPGLYAVSCQGFYYDDTNSSNVNTNSYLYAKSDSKEEQVLLDRLPNNRTTTFNSYRSTLNGRFYQWLPIVGYTYDYRQYYQRNVAAGQLMAGNDMWTAPENTYLNTVYIKVQERDGYTGPYEITLGVNKTSDTGYAYVDNFKLIYVGDGEILFDERATAEEQNGREYKSTTILNLRRTFALGEDGKGKWNPIILPMSLTGDQVKQAFGYGDAKLSVLDGLTMTSANAYCIKFKSVDLDEDNQGLEAGKCYIVYVTKGPDVAKGVEYKMPSALEDDGVKEVTGPIYQFAVNNQASYDPSQIVEGQTADVGYGVINYFGYYAKQPTGYNAGDFIMDQGDMYHLESAWGKVKYASEWSLRVPAVDALQEQAPTEGPASLKFTMKIDEGDEVDATGIIDIKVMNEPALYGNDNTGIYNVSGQKVSGDINTLPKGVYIQNGRKFLVK